MINKNFACKAIAILCLTTCFGTGCRNKDNVVNNAKDSIETNSTGTTDCLEQAHVSMEDYAAALDWNKAANTLEYDIVIAGGGASGCAAALAASEAGAKVLIVEKTDTLGGNSTQATGLFSVDPSTQTDSPVEDALLQLLTNNCETSNTALVDSILTESSSTIDWLMGLGLKLECNSNDTLNDGTYHNYNFIGNDSEQFEVVKAALERNGVDIQYNTTVTSLRKNDSGSVIGFVANRVNGEKLIVTANATILATGGFDTATKALSEQIGTCNDTALVNENFQVVTQDKTPISGLYATGICVTGTYNESVGVPYKNLSNGFAWNSGRIAGNMAVTNTQSQTK